MVVCLERDADLHMAQLMPLPLTVSCFTKILTGFTFLVPAGLSWKRRWIVCVRAGDRPDQRAVRAAAGRHGGVVRVHAPSCHTAQRHRVLVRTTSGRRHGNNHTIARYY